MADIFRPKLYAFLIGREKTLYVQCFVLLFAKKEVSREIHTHDKVYVLLLRQILH